MYKLLTVDVWDTLIRRNSHPDFSKLASAKILLLIEAENIKEEFNDQWSILRERCRIEGDFAQSSDDGEYRLGEVLAQLLLNVLNNTQDRQDLVALVSQLEEVELKFETQNTYKDPEILRILSQYSAERTVFLSDFYMSAKAIKKLLAHHSLDSIVSDGFSSCDVRLNKRVGNIFPFIHREFGVLPTEHLHIGDNPTCDVQTPSQLGIKTILFRPEGEHQKRLHRDKLFSDRQQLFRTINEESQAKAKEEISSEDTRAQEAINLGIRVAPLFVGFILHIAESVIKNNIEKLYFFTREGEFFIQIWKALFPANTLLGWQLPSCDILEVSRLSTFTASLQEVSTNEMMRIWNLYSTQSISAMLKSLGLNSHDLAALCKKHQLPLTEEIQYPWQDNRVLNLFQDQGFCTLVQAKIEHDRSLLMQYLSQRGLTAGVHRVGIVDIGWRGTIQDNLAALLKDKLIWGFYLGLQGFLNLQPSNCSKSAFGPDCNTQTNFLELLQELSLIEMLCNSPNGSVKGYGVGNTGRIEVERVIDNCENLAFEAFVVHFQKGVTLAADTWSKFIHSHVISSSELRDEGCKLWASLLKDNNPALATTYANLNHNEVFGVGEFVGKKNVPSAFDIVLAIFNLDRRSKVLEYCKTETWKAGIWGREDLTVPHRLLLILLHKSFFLLKLVKRRKNAILNKFALTS